MYAIILFTFLDSSLQTIWNKIILNLNFMVDIHIRKENIDVRNIFYNL